MWMAKVDGFSRDGLSKLVEKESWFIKFETERKICLRQVKGPSYYPRTVGLAGCRPAGWQGVN